MHILMLAQFYPPIIGGEERHVRNLSIELAARGYEVTVATLQQEGTPTFESDHGVRVYHIRGSMQRMGALFKERERQHSPPFPDPEVLWALHDIIIRGRPDIIHAHNWIVHSFVPLKAWSRAKLVVTLHDSSLICTQKRFMYHEAVCSGPTLMKCLECSTEYYGIAKGIPAVLANRIWGKMERHTVDMFLPVSQAIAEITQLDKYRVPYRIIPNFVPNNLDMSLSDAEPLLAQLPGDNYLLFVGDLTRDKGIEVLLRAYTGIKSQIPLVLIGRLGADFPAVLPSNVLVLQNWPHAAIMHAWSRCTIAVIPSIVLDACPTVAMEAMAMGRPIIASRIGGLSDIVVDGQTGIFVNPGDWQTLQVAIQRLLNNPTLRESMGTMAKLRVARFQASTVVPRIEQVYQEVLH